VQTTYIHTSAPIEQDVFRHIGRCVSTLYAVKERGSVIFLFFLASLLGSLQQRFGR
jgi:hypothetical protein